MSRQDLLSVLGEHFFLFSYFMSLFDMLLKGMIESSLLSKDELLTSHIDKVMGFQSLEGGLKIRKSAKYGFLDSGFYFLKKMREGNSVKNL